MRVEDIGIDSKSVAWTVGSEAKNKRPIKGFEDMLKDSIDDIKQLHTEDEKNTELLAIGKADNLHKIMIDAEKADIALQLMLQTRNKAIEAYQEIMRMQI